MAPMKNSTLFLAHFVQDTLFARTLNAITALVKDFNAGDDQIIFKFIFSKQNRNSFPNWVILESNCCIKGCTKGTPESFEFIHTLSVFLMHSFDDFAGNAQDGVTNCKLSGIQG